MTKNKAPKPSIADLDDEQLAAIRAYAKAKGRMWKRELCLAWMTASEPGALQRIRNNQGPEWLHRFKFPKETP